MERWLASLGAFALLTALLLWTGYTTTECTPECITASPDIFCGWGASLKKHDGQLILVDEKTSCEVPSIDATLDEYGIVVLGTPLYVFSFALPPNTMGGWVHYSYLAGYATVNGQPVTVLIELREEI